MPKVIRKPKALSKKTKPVPTPPAVKVTAGFPEFWQVAHDDFHQVFTAAEKLMPVVNKFMNAPASGKLATVIHLLAGSVTNSYGAVITLALNGYGHDAQRIMRGMLETAVNAAYLHQNPGQIDDFLDFHWIAMKRVYEYLKEYSPSFLDRVPDSTLSNLFAEYSRVEPRFLGNRKKPRNSWCKTDIPQRFEAVGLGADYLTV
jgi:hypothetical protein